MRGTLTIGDWSKDGHNQEQTVLFQVDGDVSALTGDECPKVENEYASHPTWACSKTPDLWAYYRKGVEVTGYDVTKYACKYGDSHIPLELGVALLPDEFGDYDGDEGGIDDANDIYPLLWVAIVNAGIIAMNIQATVKIVPSEKHPNFNIGGYGLFY